MITLQGYLKTRIYAMGAAISERKCKKLRDSQKMFRLSPLKFEVKAEILAA
jgi:hypothetical protein